MGARLMALLVVLAAQRAWAEPRILIVETRGTPALPTLASQVEMHAARAVTVDVRQAADLDPLTFPDAAAGLVASGAATIVVWMAPVDRGYLVFAAGGWPGRALIELVRVPSDIGPAEIERTVALKIAGLLDAMLAPRAELPAVLHIANPARPQPPAAWRVHVEGGVVHEPHERGLDGRVGITVGRTWSRDGWLVAPSAGAHWQPSGGIDSEPGHASITEVDASVGCELGRELGAWSVFARPRFVAGILFARGATDDGRSGAVTLFAPYAGLEAGARYGLSNVVAIGVVLGLDGALHHHQLLIDGQPIVDIGHVRQHVGLTLTVSL